MKIKNSEIHGKCAVLGICIIYFKVVLLSELFCYITIDFKNLVLKMCKFDI